MDEERTEAAGHVVVGLDGRWPTRGLLEVAADEGVARGSSLALVTVLRPALDLGGSVQELRAEEERTRALASSQLTRAAAALRRDHPGLEVTTHCMHEDEVEADREPLASAGLLVVGARGQYGRVALGLESVSGSLLRAAHCPVELVPDDWVVGQVSPGRTAERTAVLAAVSEHPADVEVVLAAVEEAARRGCLLRLLHAYHQWPGESAAAAVRRASDVLVAVLEGAAVPPQVRMSVLLVQDDAVAAVVSAARDTALVVVGSRHGALSGLVLDSVSRALVSSAPCLVLVLPRAAARTDV